MANYNIEMNSYNGTMYDVLYPRTLLNNITDWSSNIYSKSEVDSQISIIVPELVYNMNLNRFKTLIETSSQSGASGRIILPENNTEYDILIFSFINFQVSSGTDSYLNVSFGNTVDINNRIVRKRISVSSSTSFIEIVFILKETALVMNSDSQNEIHMIETNYVSWKVEASNDPIGRGRINIYGL